jgi:hypothetical protein
MESELDTINIEYFPFRFKRSRRIDPSSKFIKNNFEIKPAIRDRMPTASNAELDAGTKTVLMHLSQKQN